MKSIIDLHINDTERFKTCLINLNKTFASVAAGLRVYFSPVNFSRLVGVVHYFDHAINSFYQIPDILMINSDDATDYANHYRSSTGEPDDDVEAITVSELTGSTNWVNFRDKFAMRLS